MFILYARIFDEIEMRFCHQPKGELSMLLLCTTHIMHITPVSGQQHLLDNHRIAPHSTTRTIAVALILHEVSQKGTSNQTFQAATTHPFHLLARPVHGQTSPALLPDPPTQKYNLLTKKRMWVYIYVKFAYS